MRIRTTIASAALLSIGAGAASAASVTKSIDVDAPPAKVWATMNASRTSAEAPRPTGDDAPPACQRILTRLLMAAVTSQDVPKDGVSPIAKPPCHTRAGLR